MGRSPTAMLRSATTCAHEMVEAIAHGGVGAVAGWLHPHARMTVDGGHRGNAGAVVRGRRAAARRIAEHLEGWHRIEVHDVNGVPGLIAVDRDRWAVGAIALHPTARSIIEVGAVADADKLDTVSITLRRPATGSHRHAGRRDTTHAGPRLWGRDVDHT